MKKLYRLIQKVKGSALRCLRRLAPNSFINRFTFSPPHKNLVHETLKVKKVLLETRPKHLLILSGY